MIRVASTSEPQAFRDIRARAWVFAFRCLAENRRVEKVGGPDTSCPKDAERRSGEFGDTEKYA
jgi:hypothetical protein